MTIFETNRALSAGKTRDQGILPKLDLLEREPTVFDFSFGLERLPEEPGIIVIRGARQYGKSTWLQQMIRNTIDEYGHGSAFYLNGDEIRDDRVLMEEIRTLLPLFRKDADVRRLFIDEITAIADWQTTLKSLADRGELRKILVITTGSKAGDLRRGSERLPGRKGRLARTSYIFTPISFSAFLRGCDGKIPDQYLVPSYILSGGSPVACSELANNGRIPEYVVELVRDWIYGAFAAGGRSRASLLGVLECIYRFACSPVGQSKLAREAGLANNTIAAGYIDQFADLLSVAQVFPWDADHKRQNRRRPCKFHFTNLLVATAWHPRHPRTPADFLSLEPEHQGELLEWLVAQECFRRACIRGAAVPESLAFWESKEHELDFVVSGDSFIEVKRGSVNPIDFAWFPRVFPNGKLTVICTNRFETDQIRGVTMVDFMSDPSSIA